MSSEKIPLMVFMIFLLLSGCTAPTAPEENQLEPEDVLVKSISWKSVETYETDLCPGQPHKLDSDYTLLTVTADIIFTTEKEGMVFKSIGTTPIGPPSENYGYAVCTPVTRFPSLHPLNSGDTLVSNISVSGISSIDELEGFSYCFSQNIGEVYYGLNDSVCNDDYTLTEEDIDALKELLG